MAKQLVGEISEPLRAKFRADAKGLWYDIRLEKEISIRKKLITAKRKNGSKGGRPRASLSPSKIGNPNEEEIKKCFTAKGLSLPEADFETQKFMAYYSGTGWKTNRGATIVNWKAAVSNWILHRNQFIKNKQSKTLTELWLE